MSSPIQRHLPPNEPAPAQSLGTADCAASLPSPPAAEHEIMTRDEVCALLRISQTTLDSMLAEGTFDGATFKRGGIRRFLRERIVRNLFSNPTPPTRKRGRPRRS